MQGYPSEQSAKLTTDLARLLIATLQEKVPGWSKAYIRFHASDDFSEAKGSYVTSSGVYIFDVLEFKGLFSQVQSLGRELRDELTNGGQKFCLFLLSVDANFDFNMDYEWQDEARWRITKLGGASGVPEGVAGA